MYKSLVYAHSNWREDTRLNGDCNDITERVHKVSDNSNPSYWTICCWSRIIPHVFRHQNHNLQLFDGDRLILPRKVWFVSEQWSSAVPICSSGGAAAERRAMAESDRQLSEQHSRFQHERWTVLNKNKALTKGKSSIWVSVIQLIKYSATLY